MLFIKLLLEEQYGKSKSIKWFCPHTSATQSCTGDFDQCDPMYPDLDKVTGQRCPPPCSPTCISDSRGPSDELGRRRQRHAQGGWRRKTGGPGRNSTAPPQAHFE